MTSGAYTGYLVRYLKQVGYIKQRKIRKGKVHRHKKSLFISSVTISGVLDYILINTQYKQSPKKKKKKKGDKGERQNEKKTGKREKKKRSVIGKKKRKRGV